MPPGDTSQYLKDTGFVLGPLRQPGLELEIDNNYVRAYRRTLMKDQEFSLGKEDRSLILVSLSDFNAKVKQNGVSKRRIMRTGEFIIINKGDSFSLSTDGSSGSQFGLIELPVR